MQRDARVRSSATSSGHTKSLWSGKACSTQHAAHKQPRAGSSSCALQQAATRTIRGNRQRDKGGRKQQAVEKTISRVGQTLSGLKNLKKTDVSFPRATDRDALDHAALAPFGKLLGGVRRERSALRVSAARSRKVRILEADNERAVAHRHIFSARATAAHEQMLTVSTQSGVCSRPGVCGEFEHDEFAIRHADVAGLAAQRRAVAEDVSAVLAVLENERAAEFSLIQTVSSTSHTKPKPFFTSNHLHLPNTCSKPKREPETRQTNQTLPGAGVSVFVSPNAAVPATPAELDAGVDACADDEALLSDVVLEPLPADAAGALEESAGASAAASSLETVRARLERGCSASTPFSFASSRDRLEPEQETG